MKFVTPDIDDDGIDAFIDGVIPMLQERGLSHQDYGGTMLRDHLNARAQYGLDPLTVQSRQCSITANSLRNTPDSTR